MSTVFFHVFIPELLTGVILAGGQAKRMAGQDKGLITFQDKYLIEHVIAALRPQVGTLLISANRHRLRYAELGQCPVLSDQFGHYAGPLAGMAAGLQAAKTELVVFVPCDAPLLTHCLVARLYAQLIRQQAEISVVDDGTRLQPTFALLKKQLLPDLLAFLKRDQRKIQLWYDQHTTVRVDFSDHTDAFLNINTPEELAALAAKQAP